MIAAPAPYGAVAYCHVKHELAAPKNDGMTQLYVPSSSEIEDATLATKAIRSLFRHGNVERLDNLEKKRLTSARAVRRE